MKKIFCWFKHKRPSLIKTLFVNLKCLPIKKAVKLPIYVYPSLKLTSIGLIKVEGEIIRGMIRLGNSSLFIANNGELRNNGTIIFKGSACILSGTVINNSGTIIFDDNIMVGENCKLLIVKGLIVGKRSRIAFDTVFMDTDFHPIINTETKEVYPLVKAITIGAYNWVGHGSSIHKGTSTADFSIISSNTTLSSFTSDKKYSLIAGNPPRIVKNNIRRIYNPKSETMIFNYFREGIEKENYKVEVGDDKLNEFILD